jgi:hypothetical protein
MQFIGEAMSKNHKILGLHLMGNEASVDELGFISPEQVWNAGMAHVFTRIPCKFGSFIDSLQTICRLVG